MSSQNILKCPNCGATDFDLTEYESLMMVSETDALFTLRCPHCGTIVSSLCVVPDSLRGEINDAAEAIGAGMGHDL